MGVITESERAKWFAYYDGVADGLNKSRNDVNAVLDKIRAEIESASHGKWYVGRIDGKSEEVLLLDEVLKIIDKYREG